MFWCSQVIRAEQLVGAGQRHLPLPRDLATFGGSIAGGMDMDGNGYPGRSGNVKVAMLKHASWDVSTFSQLRLESDAPVDIHCCDWDCIFEIDLLLDAHKTRDRDIVQLCLLSGHCCCSRKTCNTEAWTIPQCWHTSHAFSSFSYMYFHNFLGWNWSIYPWGYIKHLLFTLRLLISKK